MRGDAENGSGSGSWDVIVIGAGIAGLAAACDLAHAGRRVLVLEARDRVGGRVHTLHDDRAGVPVELGGEFVDRTDNDAWALAQRAALAGVDVPDEHWYVERGRADTQGDFWHPVQRELARARRRPDRPFAAFLRERFPGGEHAQLRERATAYVEGFHAADAARASTHELADAEQAVGFGGNEQVVLVRGAGALAAELARTIERNGSRIRLATMVARVRWRRGDVRVEAVSAHGEPAVVRARAAVVTLPLPLLAAPAARGSVRFEPALTAKQDAAGRLAMGSACKLVLAFAGRPWEAGALRGENGRIGVERAKFVHTPDSVVPTWWTALPVRAPLLTAWAAGPAARRLARLDPRERLAQALAAIALAARVPVRELRRDLREVWHHDWDRDPHARGAYSYVPVGGRGAREQLAAPLQRTLFFAGEATSVDEASTIHGAFASGRRAARELLAMRRAASRS
jgi:monoamine oxidase